MIWLAVIFVAAVLVAVFLSRPDSPPDEVDYRVQADLYAIRRRLDVAQFKHEVRRDGMRMKRELRKELDG